jgi:hypothetical protein
MRTLSIFGAVLLLSGCATPAPRDSLSIPSTREVAAEVSGRTVRLAKVGATFRVPASWVERSEIEKAMGEEYSPLWKRMYYSPAELKGVEHGSGEWDTEYAEVINAVVPFESCVIHAGDESWGRGACSFGDIQMRAYVGDWDQTVLRQFAEQKGVSAAKRFSEEVRVSASVKGVWNLASIHFRLSYGDYGGTTAVDIYSRHCSSSTVVLAFMHCSDLLHQKRIDEILESFDDPQESQPNQPPLPTPGKCPPSNHDQLPGAADL